MAPVTPAAWMQAEAYSARLDRQVLGTLITPDAGASPMAARSGIKPGPQWSGMQVTQRTTPDMWVSVWGGSCVIQAADTYGGAYICQNDGVFDLGITAAHASLPRRDLVYAQVRDAVDHTGDTNEFVIQVATGTPATVPAAPALPPQALALAELYVPAGATSVVNANITDRRVWTVGLGGTLPVRSDAEIPPFPYAGMKIYRTGQRIEQVWDGAAWRTLMDTGFGYQAGTLAFGAFNPEPAHTITSTGGMVVREGNTPCRLHFTMPSGVPASRALRFTISAHVQPADGARTWSAPLFDSTFVFNERRIDIPNASGFSYGWTGVYLMAASGHAPGEHYMEWRLRVDNSSAGIAVHSFEMHIELV